MQASDIGFLMLVGIAVVGSLISLLDHRSQFGSASPASAPQTRPSQAKAADVSNTLPGAPE